MNTDETIDKAAEAMHSDQCPEDPEPGDLCTCDGGYYDRLARVLADADLLADARLMAERDEWRATLQRVRELHRKMTDDDGPYCYQCCEPYPCATVRILDGDDQ